MEWFDLLIVPCTITRNHNKSSAEPFFLDCQGLTPLWFYESQSESYVTTDGQSASLSWYKAPIRGLRPDFFFRSAYGMRLTVTFLIPWVALSDERTGLSFVCAAGPCQRSLPRGLVSWDSRPYFTVSDLRLLFVASYDSQGHGGGIRPRLHTGTILWLCSVLLI
jgi:hypothetical protein